MREQIRIAGWCSPPGWGSTTRRSTTVSNMAFSPAFLISFHSKVIPLHPGDVISTGTPGAVHINPGDVA
ncbi:fumarylacetoacetate hydrolase family protein [Kribbella sp. NPDC023972]|uniref:fumarylacetoacetate hydrolase family protein n=1 Tax=Kribbella sp. NPDC023972 TaxID=3154795 RepID=UPI0033EC56A6